MDLDQYMIAQDKQDLIKQSLLRTYFKDKDREFLDSEYGKNDINANVNQRYLHSLTHIVPWVAGVAPLAERNVIEIGCGTGSSSAAFSHFVRSITAYDIDAKSVEAARDRIDILGIENISFVLVEPENLISGLQDDHPPNSADMILLFAVLEHMTIAERHETINVCWELLSDDGVLVIAETPNLLHYYDFHTSVLPFFHMLPTDLCTRYAHKSPRDGFNDQFDPIPNSAEADLALMRWGRGVSYHDFELTIGPEYGEHIIANGYEPEILSWFPVNLEEEVLRYYMEQKGYDIPAALQRFALNMVLKKSVAGEPDRELPPAPALTIGDSSYMDKYLEYSRELAAARKRLDEILASKRWKIGSVIGSPYRAVKRFFSSQD